MFGLWLASGEESVRGSQRSLLVEVQIGQLPPPLETLQWTPMVALYICHSRHVYHMQSVCGHTYIAIATKNQINFSPQYLFSLLHDPKVNEDSSQYCKFEPPVSQLGTPQPNKGARLLLIRRLTPLQEVGYVHWLARPVGFSFTFGSLFVSRQVGPAW